MPSKDFMRRYTDAAPDEGTASRVRNARSRIKMDSFGAGLLGVADTVTFGYLDEIGAGVDTLTRGGTYDSNLQRNRDILGQADEEHGSAYLTGQIAGGFVPFLGWGGRTVKGATLAGAGFGALYGTGSSDGDLGDRLQNGLVYGAVGGLGGYLVSGVLIPTAKWAGGRTVAAFTRGKNARIDAKDLPPSGLFETLKEAHLSDDLTAPKAKPTAAAPEGGLNPNTSLGPKAAATAEHQLDDTLEDGALVTVKDLLGEPEAAAKAVAKRLGKMTPQAAEKLLKDITQAEQDGSVVTNPHFRSLLKIDLTGVPLEQDQLVRAAEIFENAIESLADKAGQRTRTVAGMDQQVQNELRKGLTLGELEQKYQQSQNGFVDTRIAQHVMLTATAKVVRLREELLPQLVKGVEGARERLVEELTDAAHRMVFAKGILSNAGRALGILSHGVNATMVEVADDAYKLTANEIRARVDKAVNILGDDHLKDLLGSVRTMADAENIERILLNEAEAEAFTTWKRAVGSVSLWLRSNALTPATFGFNIAGFIGHVAIRQHYAKRVAATALEKAGKLDEAVALRLEEQITRSVRWQATQAGLKAMLKRVQWEFWTDVESVASVGWGSGSVSAKARLKRSTMLADGYTPPSMREFDDKPRLNINDTAAFNQRIEEARAQGGAFANLMYHAQKARAVAANSLDAVGGLGMKVFTAMPDDMGKEYIRITEGFAQSAREAFREARAAGVPSDQIEAYVKSRARELAEMPTAEMMQKIEASILSTGELQGEAKFLVNLNKMIEEEADAAVFMDGPQTELGKVSANFISKIDRIGLVLPYVRTPIRLMERGLVDYGPLGHVAKGVREAIAAGGVEGELAKARLEVGMRVFNAGMVLGLARGITVTNGGFDNSANLDAGPPNRLNLPGGGFIEIGRLDPFSFTVAVGALIGQAFRDGYKEGTEYDQEQAIRAAASTTVMGAYDAILSKSYMQGLQQLMDAVPGSGGDDEQWLTSVEKILQNAVSRFVPMGGVGRQFNDTFRDSAIETVGWTDTVLRTIPGAGYGLSPRIDPLGDEAKARWGGVNFGSSERTEGGPISDVKRKLRDLGIDITTIRKSDPDGFNLTSEELSEVRRIRGKEALNSEGLTMHEALGELFDDPWFQGLPTKDAKRSAVVDTMREFNKPAWELLQERNPKFASKKVYHSSLADYIAEGLTRKQAEAEASTEVEAQGLPQPTL